MLTVCTMQRSRQALYLHLDRLNNVVGYERVQNSLHGIVHIVELEKLWVADP